MTENAGSKISCQDVSPSKGFEMKNRPKPTVRPVDIRLECCILAGFRKTTKYSAFKLSCQSPLFGFRFSCTRYAKNICIFRRSQEKEKPVGMAEVFSADPGKNGLFYGRSAEPDLPGCFL
jgi:hypothetical protein